MVLMVVHHGLACKVENKSSTLTKAATLKGTYFVKLDIICLMLHLHLLHINTYFNSTIQHEFMHALGAYHVQSRSDRDDFVEIKWDNIKEKEKHNFKKHSKALTYGIPYDPLSIMHYESQAFAIDRTKPTIVSKVCMKQ